MTQMTEEHRMLLRRTIGHGMMIAQNEMSEANGYPAADIVPEILSALLSLSSYVAMRNTGLSREEFLACCAAAADENYPKETREGNEPDDPGDPGAGTLVPD